MGWPSAEVIAAYGDLIRALQWPIVALIVVGFFRQEIKEISRRLKRGKLLGNEFDLSDEIQQAKSDIQASEAEVKASNPVETDLPSNGFERTNEDIQHEVIQVASLSPAAAVMLVASEIESYMRWLAGNAEYQLRPRAGVLEIGEEMVRQGTLSPNTLKSLKSFWNLRNRVVHGLPTDDHENMQVMDIGLALLKQIRNSN